ncbi:unnamed protein product [Prunus armeniaca]
MLRVVQELRAWAELPNEDIGAHFTIDNERAELPNEDIGAHVTIDNEGAELPNEDEDADSKIKDSNYEFSENEAEDRPTVGENVADEGTSHGAPGEVSSDGADTSKFDSGSETDSKGNGRKKIKLPKFKQYRRDVDLKNPEFRLGMKFANKKLLIEAIKELAIIEDFDMKSFQQDVLEDYKINVTKLQVCRAKKLARDLNEGCRPVIGVDGCHLKGPYPGQILMAIGVDGNNDLGITNGQAWVVIIDKQKGLLPAIERVLPSVEHRMCVRHLYSNFKASHIGLALKHILWAAARATTVPWWEAEMEKMKNEDEEAWKWLNFNAAILDARDKTILSFLERIRVYVMLRMASRRSACQNWRYSVGPRIFKIIEKNKLGSSQCIPRLVGEKLYQVSHIYGGEFVVDLRAKTCSCRRWNLCGIPCPHAISAIDVKTQLLMWMVVISWRLI